MYTTKVAFCVRQGFVESNVLWVAASQAAEKVPRFVGRAFRHDIKSAFPSGVLTPEGPKGHFSATCSAATFSDLRTWALAPEAAQKTSSKDSGRGLYFYAEQFK